MNIQENQEKLKILQQVPVNLQQDYICYSSEDHITREDLSSKLAQLTQQECNHLGYTITIAKKNSGICFAATDTFQSHGAGCRNTQKQSREKLQSLGLLKVYDRIQWGSPFKRPPLQIIASYLLDEANAFIVKQFCGIPFYFPISVLKQLKSIPVKHALDHNLTEGLRKKSLLVNLATHCNREEWKALMSEQLQRDEMRSKSLRPPESKNLQGDEMTQSNNGKYGGSKIYDVKKSQFEIDLQAKVHERQKRKYSMDPVIADSEAQPSYNEPTVSQERKQAYHPNTMYSPYVKVDRPAENPDEATKNLIAWTKTEQYKKFVAFCGEAEALKMCRNIVNSALNDSLEKK